DERAVEVDGEQTDVGGAEASRHRHARIGQAPARAASDSRSLNVTIALGGSPSSGTTLTAPSKSSLVVYVLVVIRHGMPAPFADSSPLRLSSMTMQLEPGTPSRALARL